MTRHVVLLGHGSRAPGADTGIRRAASDLNVRTGWSVRVAHMELCEPGLPETVAAFVSEGADQVLVVPYFLHMGVHLREDIPGILDGIRATHPGTEIRLAPQLGYDSSFAEVLERRVIEGVATA